MKNWNSPTIYGEGEDNSDSKAIYLLRFPLAVMVICIHCYLPSSSNYLIILLSHVLSHIAVPLFFIISGYFFFTKIHAWDWNIWFNKISKRFKTLLLPYFLWIILFIVYSFIPSFIKGIIVDNHVSFFDWFINHDGFHMFWDSYKWDTDRVDIWGNTAINSAPILVPFWFMRDLMVAVCLTPLFYILLRPRVSLIGRYFPLIVLFCLGMLFLTSTSLIVPGFSSLTFFFFGLGAYFQLHNKSLVAFVSKYSLPICIIASVLLVLNVLYDGKNTEIGSYFYNPWVIFGVCAALYLSSKLTRIRSTFVSWIIEKSDCTFFLFAVHAFLIPYIKMFINLVFSRFVSESDIFCVSFGCQHPIIYSLIYIMVILTTITLSILIFKFCQKYFPRIYNILTGR